MAHRTFRAADGAEWQVWNVVPGVWRHSLTVGHERRLADRRSPEPVLRYTGPERRRADRRRRIDVVSPTLAGGWLTFEHAGERRRLAPVPAGWEALPERELASLCAAAEPVPRRTAD